MIIGYAYVVGDILHEGHLLHLRNCKGLCDRLIVGVLTDQAAMEKKPKPAKSFYERIAIISALSMVDAAVPQDEYEPTKNINEIKPDILFECQQHERYGEFHGYNGRVIAMPYYPGISSTDIKERIRENR